jgi:nicotinamidase/pyrazinamidase
MGTRGHSVVPAINIALQFWAQQRQRTVQYVHKGQALRTETYSAFRYKVEDSGDTSTLPNEGLIQKMKIADKLLICGQSLNKAVFNTAHGEDLILSYIGRA